MKAEAVELEVWFAENLDQGMQLGEIEGENGNMEGKRAARHLVALFVAIIWNILS